ncbi:MULTISPECIES: SOS response-associated peptidase [unclassified Prochlorococcus]|uniref:SOS response-associated peptidase n=1 Tax=unclassified Prochlorococcus TaxID=2627481 RepID=UPI00053382FD|nr:MULTISPECIES: SOS response-associated peptidase [unclassified Prochlorococcus]KGG15584.1 hypothetical protein EV06_1458 [Prochlorococcus sp. MIT 0602]KGG17864.1 hypothetical protein EV07_1306 [Prochlorococcus sp. MIT 0603]
MCGRYKLTTEFKELPTILKKNLPKGFEQNYAKQELIRPSDPVLVVKNEGKISSALMIWGYISEWAKSPFEENIPRPFNARSETVSEKKIFRSSWRYKRCLIPANGFFEKDFIISRKDLKTFWLGGIWSRWMSSDGSELESCCVLTTQSNELIKPLHHRMPVIIPNGLEADWLVSVKDLFELRALEPMLGIWSSAEWKIDKKDRPTSQMELF